MEMKYERLHEKIFYWHPVKQANAHKQQGLQSAFYKEMSSGTQEMTQGLSSPELPKEENLARTKENHGSSNSELTKEVNLAQTEEIRGLSGIRVPEGCPEMKLAVNGANRLIREGIRCGVWTAIVEQLTGPKVDLQEVFEHPPPISFSKDKGTWRGLAYSRKEESPLAQIKVRRDFQRRLKALFDAQKGASDEFYAVSGFLSIILFHEFSHVVVCWKQEQKSPIKFSWVTADAHVQAGDAGFTAEILLFHGIAALTRKLRCSVQNTSKTKYLRILFHSSFSRNLIEWSMDDIKMLLTSEDVEFKFQPPVVEDSAGTCLLPEERIVDRGQDEEAGAKAAEGIRLQSDEEFESEGSEESYDYAEDSEGEESVSDQRFSTEKLE